MAGTRAKLFLGNSGGFRGGRVTQTIPSEGLLVGLGHSSVAEPLPSTQEAPGIRFGMSMWPETLSGAGSLLSL